MVCFFVEDDGEEFFEAAIGYRACHEDVACEFCRSSYGYGDLIHFTGGGCIQFILTSDKAVEGDKGVFGGERYR